MTLIPNKRRRGWVWGRPKTGLRGRHQKPFGGGWERLGKFRGYAKKMLLAGGVRRRLWGKACTMQTWGTYSRSVTLRCTDSICRTLPSLTLWNTQGLGVLIYCISAFTLDRLLRDELTHELRRSPAWRGGRLRRTPTAKWKKSKCEDAILL